MFDASQNNLKCFMLQTLKNTLSVQNQVNPGESYDLLLMSSVKSTSN